MFITRLSPKNLLGKYLKITDKDCFIAEYVDYFKFYAVFNPERLAVFYRDNGPSMDVGPFHLQKQIHPKALILKIQLCYKNHVLDIGQLVLTTVNKQRVLSVDIYGKGIYVLNKEHLRQQLDFIFLYFEIGECTITRIDYAVDCEKMNFKKKNTLGYKKTRSHGGKKELEYVGFGSYQNSPLYLRYYNKKLDLLESGMEWLYPEYEQYNTVMRYELRVLSDGIDKSTKNCFASDIETICNFGKKIEYSQRDHHDYKIIEDKDFLFIQEKIREYKKQKQTHKLGLLFNLLYNSY